jgi:hypothetical protein
MKTPMTLILIALFSILVPWTAWGATADAMVVFSGKTEVNRRAYNWIHEVFQKNNIGYSLAATLDPSSVKPGQYKTVVVVNTGTTSGVDPVLQKFINGFNDKKDLYLINLFRNSGDLTVTSFTAGSSPEGVDGVSAASTWRSAWMDGQDVRKMHLTWVADLIMFLGRA